MNASHWMHYLRQWKLHVEHFGIVSTYGFKNVKKQSLFFMMSSVGGLLLLLLRWKITMKKKCLIRICNKLANLFMNAPFWQADWSKICVRHACNYGYGTRKNCTWKEWGVFNYSYIFLSMLLINNIFRL